MQVFKQVEKAGLYYWKFAIKIFFSPEMYVEVINYFMLHLS